MERLFYHLDNKFLLKLIEEMKEDVLYNLNKQPKYILNSKEEMTKIFVAVDKIIK